MCDVMGSCVQVCVDLESYELRETADYRAHTAMELGTLNHRLLLRTVCDGVGTLSNGKLGWR